MAEPIVVRLLGPIEVIGPQGAAILVGARQRSLVALLALQPGKAMGSERIIDGLWGEEAPRTALRTLQSHLARIRHALAQAGLPNVLLSGPAGHVLQLPALAVDAHVFADRVRHARACLAAGALHEAVTAFQEGLGLWRGEAFQDGEANGQASAEVGVLHDMRSSAVEDLGDARLRLGDHARVIGDLQQLLAEHPYREKPAGLLMLALYRAGRGAEALTIYQRLRADLAEGLGADPGPELQQLHAAILRQDPALEIKAAQPISGPAELPPRVGYFTGRVDEFADLDKLLAVREVETDHKIVLVSGAAGMGKSALAVEWAHHVARRFPDGQLFVDLLGHDPQTTLGPAAVVSRLLRGLGVPAERVPDELSEQASLYRSLIHDRRYLILLDNARSVEQLLPAVPATRTSLLVITSRQELSALAVRQPVHFVQMGALDRDTGLSLLRRAVDTERIEGDRAAAAELVDFCGGMPLAIRITAARLASRPALTIADLVGDIRLRELDALAVPGDAAGIRAVFASAYQSLSAPVRRTFALLSLHPGPSFSVHLAAAATGGTTAQTEAHLAELAGTSLVIQEGDRYRFHDLIRLYAAECAKAQEAAAGAQARICDWYLGIAHAANRVLDPGRNRVAIAAEPAQVPFGLTHQETIEFLEGEQPSLGPVVRWAAATDHNVAAWQLTYLVAGFYDSRGRHDRLEMCGAGLRAAQELGHAEAEVLMRNLYAATCVQMRRFTEALEQLDAALNLALRLPDAWYRATTYTNKAVANTWLRRFDAAQDAFERALEIHATISKPHDIALCLNNLGDVQRRAGKGDEALAYLQRALDIAATLAMPRLEAIIRHSKGQAHQALGAHALALAEFGQALVLRRQIGDRRGEASALEDIGAIHFELQQTSQAIAAYQEALELSRLLENTHLESVLLDRIGEALLQEGDLPAAATALQHSLRLRRQIPDLHEEERLQRNLDKLGQPRG
ncbi:AfsR/SARP family transcriptional regulator [Rhizocola hellebori]|uniref:AfsR/SARP family transcriptional regulator n=1 Tax=Rhizocola hellebori TaxID=1392758 RepID=UPI001943D438|nr:BTAD domain-containing putative transcriptional regulator [Rhizocola hellebori]